MTGVFIAAALLPPILAISDPDQAFPEPFLASA